MHDPQAEMEGKTEAEQVKVLARIIAEQSAEIRQKDAAYANCNIEQNKLLAAHGAAMELANNQAAEQMSEMSKVLAMLGSREGGGRLKLKGGRERTDDGRKSLEEGPDPSKGWETGNLAIAGYETPVEEEDVGMESEDSDEEDEPKGKKGGGKRKDRSPYMDKTLKSRATELRSKREGEGNAAHRTTMDDQVVAEYTRDMIRFEDAYGAGTWWFRLVYSLTVFEK